MSWHRGKTPGGRRTRAERQSITAAAAVLLMLAGVFGVIQGIVGLANDNFYIVAQKWAFQFNPTT